MTPWDHTPSYPIHPSSPMVLQTVLQPFMPFSPLGTSVKRPFGHLLGSPPAI